MPPSPVGEIIASIRLAGGNIEVRAVELGDGLIGHALHPLAQRVPPGDPARRVGVQCGNGLADRAARHDLVGRALQLVLNPDDLGPAPGVSLRRVDHGTEEVPRGQREPLPARRVVSWREREQFGPQELAHLGGRGTRRHRSRVKFGPERAGGFESPGQSQVEAGLRC